MLNQLLTVIKTTPSKVEFTAVIDAIDASYDFTPTQFVNGLGPDAATNEAGTNNGSCRVLAFAQLHSLSEEQTLHCFGEYYRKDVLENPEGNDHANIRNFMRDGWKGLSFAQPALTAKS